MQTLLLRLGIQQEGLRFLRGVFQGVRGSGPYRLGGHGPQGFPVLFQAKGLPAGGIEAVPAGGCLIPAFQGLFRCLCAAQGFPLPVQILQPKVQLRPVCPIPGQSGGGIEGSFPVVFRQLKPLLRIGCGVLPRDGRPLLCPAASVGQGKQDDSQPQHPGRNPENGFPQRQQHPACKERGEPCQQKHQPLLYFKAPVPAAVLPGLCFRPIGVQLPEGSGGFGRGRRGRKQRFLQLGRAPAFRELLCLQEHLPGFLPGGKPGTGTLQFLRPLHRPVKFLSCFRHLGGVGLRAGIAQGLGVIAQGILPGRHLALTDTKLPCLLFQSRQRIQLLHEGFQLLLGLGQEAGSVVAAAVFQLPQGAAQLIRVPAFIPGGDQGVEPPPQGFILGHGQIRKPDKACPGKDASLHPQQPLAAVCPIQLRHRQPGRCLIGPELAQRDPPLGGAFNGNVPALPV